MAQPNEAVNLGYLGEPVAFMCSCKPLVVQHDDRYQPEDLALAGLDAVATWVLLTTGLHLASAAESSEPAQEADLGDLGEPVVFACSDCGPTGTTCATWVRVRRLQGLRPDTTEVVVAIAGFVHAWRLLMPQRAERS